MPCISTKVNMELDLDKEVALKTEFGKAISVFPGKNEEWLMLSFEDNCHLYFRGKNDVPAALIEVSLFGQIDPKACEAFTERVMAVLERQLALDPSNIYIKYCATDHWGWNGSNF
jgi:phenylpyruvate tautomerase PptA (4-oxalocrotonate tautomerase family)